LKNINLVSVSVDILQNNMQILAVIFVHSADPDPEGSETFGQIRIRSRSEINISNPYSTPDPNPGPNSDPKKGKGALFRPK